MASLRSAFLASLGGASTTVDGGGFDLRSIYSHNPLLFKPFETKT